MFCRIIIPTVSLLLPFFAGTLSFNILVSHPFYCGSHVLTVHTITKELLSRGHTVTTVKYRDDRLPPLSGHPNLTVIDLTINNTHTDLKNVDPGEEGQYRLPMKGIWMNGNSLVWTLWETLQTIQIARRACYSTLNPKLIERLSQKKFDVAIVDLLVNECGLALANRLDVPAVGFGFAFTGASQEFTTQDVLVSHVPALMSHLSNRMTFLERTTNLLSKLVSKTGMYLYISKMDIAIQDNLPGSPLASELYGNLSGVIINSDFVLEYPRAQPPTFINVGGMQLTENPGPLPQRLQDFLNSAGEEGVILFSLGFIFDPSAVPQEFVQKLFTAFAKLKQKVVLKYESLEGGSTAPDNVLVLPYLPQQAVLAHNNTRLFVTHCGVNGVMEAIYHKVPMVGIPLFIDQGDVMKRMEDAGIAIRLDRDSDSHVFSRTLIEAMENVVIRENVAALSELMRLRQNPPKEDAIWLLEYVARTKGANHLKLESRNLNLFQLYSLDSILFLALLISLPALILITSQNYYTSK